jgi:anti-anti-sigma factor
MFDVKLSQQTIRESPRVILVGIAGEADAANGCRTESYFDEVLQTTQPRHVLLNLGDLTFAGSAFFSTLLFWREAMSKRGGMLVLFGLKPEIASTMRILALDRVLTVRADEQAALAALPNL